MNAEIKYYVDWKWMQEEDTKAKVVEVLSMEPRVGEWYPYITMHPELQDRVLLWVKTKRYPSIELTLLAMECYAEGLRA